MRPGHFALFFIGLKAMKILHPFLKKDDLSIKQSKDSKHLKIQMIPTILLNAGHCNMNLFSNEKGEIRVLNNFQENDLKDYVEKRLS